MGPGAPDVSAAADFFHESPWSQQAVRADLAAFMLGHLIETAQLEGAEPVVYISIVTTKATLEWV